MTPLDLARVFLSKAREDLEALELLAPSRVADEIVGFHAQQAVEKALKAVLTAADVRVGRTHDIGHLLSLVADARIEAPDWLAEVTALGPYAVLARYAEVATDEPLDRTASIVLTRRVLLWAADRLGETE